MPGLTAGLGTERTGTHCLEKHTDCVSVTKQTSSDSLIQAVTVACSVSFRLATDKTGLSSSAQTFIYNYSTSNFL